MASPVTVTFQQSFFMTNNVEVFYAKRCDPNVVDYVSTGDPRMGTREAIHRDGMVIAPMSQAFCPREWLDEHGYVDPARALKPGAMDSLRALSAKCACGCTVFELKRHGENDSVVCLDCGNGMFKSSFDAHTGGWMAGWINPQTMLRLRDVVGM